MNAALSKDAAHREEASDTATSDPMPEPVLGPEIQNQLGALLRGMYDDLLGRPVPDRFVEILQRLDRRPEGDPS